MLNTQRKIQSLVIRHLLQMGKINLVLPSEVTLEIGIVEEDGCGNTIKDKGYCYVIVTRNEFSTILDSFNIGLSFPNSRDSVVVDEYNEYHDQRQIEVI